MAAAALLLIAAPIWLVVAIGIKASDPGPVFYVARRSGLRGAIFPMFKFRTMRIGSDRHSRIAAAKDSRVFPFGTLLRRLKLDELPQLINIIRGEMAFVGPRPEDPWIVERFYSNLDRQTLEVLPGLTSPGSLYYVAEAEQALASVDTEAAYVNGPLRTKLDLDRAYIHKASAGSDLRVILQTALVLLRLSSYSR